MNPHCRIGRVRMKNGGAEVRVLEPGPARGAAELHAKLRRHVKVLIEMFPDMAGYALVCWDKDAGFSRAKGATAESSIGVTLMPSFVAEVLRRDTVEDVCRERFVTPDR